jgi:hypothetical protein
MLAEVQVRLVGAILGAAIGAASTASASASSVDRVSADKFLAEATTYVRVSLSRHSQLNAAANRFIEHLRLSCPSSLGSAPSPIAEHALGRPPSKEGMEGTPAQRATSQAFLTMALGELQVAHYVPIRAPALRFATELSRLRWTNPAIENAVTDSAQSLVATLALRPPDFCADARASAATGFALAPPEATQFVSGFRAATLVNEGRSLPELADMMRPVLPPSGLKELARFQRLWLRGKPLVQVSDATVSRLLRVVFQPHRVR